MRWQELLILELLHSVGRVASGLTVLALARYVFNILI